MATHNDITGDALVSKLNNDNFRNNFDRIFGKKKTEEESSPVKVPVTNDVPEQEAS
jgi:hypothetical protein